MKTYTTTMLVIAATFLLTSTNRASALYVLLNGEQEFPQTIYSVDVYGDLANPEIDWTVKTDPWQSTGTVQGSNQPYIIDFETTEISSNRASIYTLEVEPNVYRTSPIPMYARFAGTYQVLQPTGLETGTFDTGRVLYDELPATLEVRGPWGGIADMPMIRNPNVEIDLFTLSTGETMTIRALQENDRFSNFYTHSVPEPTTAGLVVLAMIGLFWPRCRENDALCGR